MSIQEQRRERFAEYAMARGLGTGRTEVALCFRNGRRVPVGGYILHETAEAWEAYNAALDGLEVDLPKIDISLSSGHSDAFCEGVLYAQGKDREALAAAGLKVAP